MGMAFFGPALVLLTIFLFLPMILTLIFSFTDFFALNPGLTHFVGLDNYIQIFKDDVFSQAFFNTVKFVIIIVPLQGIGALVLALLINKVTHCKKYFKVAFFVPVVMSLAVVSTLWIQIYSPEGIMNAILSFFGIDAQPFINSASQALPSIAIMSAWQGMGYQMIIFLGGIQLLVANGTDINGKAELVFAGTGIGNPGSSKGCSIIFAVTLLQIRILFICIEPFLCFICTVGRADQRVKTFGSCIVHHFLKPVISTAVDRLIVSQFDQINGPVGWQGMRHIDQCQQPVVFCFCCGGKRL